MKTLLFVLLCASILTIYTVQAQSISTQERTCNKNTNCEDCLAGNSTVNVDCYWCSKPSNRSAPKCRHYTFNSAIPVDGIECDNLQYNVATCRLNALVIVILIVLACLLFVIFLCCVSCCCCFFFARRRQERLEKDDRVHLEKREEIREKYNLKRLMRKTKNDEIRKKYGLKTDDDGEVET